MKRNLALIIPTRNRVSNALRLWDQIWATVHGSTFLTDDIYFIVGEDDPSKWKYLAEVPSVEIFPDHGLVKALNWTATRLSQKYECLAFMGDDHFPKTEGWDEMYVNELYSLGDGFVYGDDLLMGERIPTQIAMTSSIVETLGFFTPPGFTHLCCDLAWKDLGEGIDKITYMPEVVIEHLHPAAGKAEEDEGYKFVNSPEMVQRDEAEYFRWKSDDLPGQLEKLRGGLRSLQ